MLPAIIVSVILAGAVFVVLSPLGCFQTLQAIPPDGPDPNEVSGTSVLPGLALPWGEIDGGYPGTDDDWTAYDVLRSRMLKVALSVAALPLASGVLAGWMTLRQVDGRGGEDPRRASRGAPRDR